MTNEEFDKTPFGKGMKINYQNEEFLISQVDFEERLIGYIKESDLEAYEHGLVTSSWCRSDNCEIIN